LGKLEKKEYAKMIIVKLMGGLGNQMFQYAAGRNIALRNKTGLKLDNKNGFIDDFYNRKYLLNNFNIKENIAQLSELPYTLKQDNSSNLFSDRAIRYINKHIPIDGYNITKERNLCFDSNAFIPRKKQYLIGYWQSEKYFSDISDIIENEFTLKYPLTGKNLEVAEVIKNSNSLCVHFRRLHGISSGVTSYAATEIHGSLGLDYYQNAISYIERQISNLEIFVFSDQPDWVKENFKSSSPTYFIDHNDDDHNYEDLRLMSLCKHQVISNSTFSWWAAWLNSNTDKIVIAPKIWFANKEMNDQTCDLIPYKWIRL
jgi:hypothetical protein